MLLESLREIIAAIRDRKHLSAEVQKNETHLVAYCHVHDDVKYTDITEHTKPMLVAFLKQHQYCA